MSSALSVHLETGRKHGSVLLSRNQHSAVEAGTAPCLCAARRQGGETPPAGRPACCTTARAGGRQLNSALPSTVILHLLYDSAGRWPAG